MDMNYIRKHLITYHVANARSAKSRQRQQDEMEAKSKAR